ncbi:MAG TPA: hypothetical protein VI279_14065 [Rhodocyclaceae bacterium]
MSEALIREIANQILREVLIQNWLTYAILAALLVISGAVSAYGANYLRKRAETYATKADFDELLRQLRATTAAAESVRSEIAKADWAEREWKTLRRVKLEELLTAMHAATHHLDTEQNARFFDEELPTDASPIWKVEALSSLYFPELSLQASAFSLMFAQYRSWVIDVQAQLSTAGNDPGKRQAVFDIRFPEMKELHPKLLAAAQLLTASASRLMRVVADVSVP